MVSVHVGLHIVQALDLIVTGREYARGGTEGLLEDCPEGHYVIRQSTPLAVMYVNESKGT
jgi:hypothetical protein